MGRALDHGGVGSVSGGRSTQDRRPGRVQVTVGQCGPEGEVWSGCSQQPVLFLVKKKNSNTSLYLKCLGWKYGAHPECRP